MIIVTGGAGFIGSALIWALNERGISDVLVVDRLDKTEKWKNLVPLRFRDYIDADVFERTLLEKPVSLGKIDSVYHLGACSSTTETDAAYLMRNNYEYTKNLATWAVASDIRFVYASSAATYGALEHGLHDDADLDLLRPLNMYAYSKHRFDIYARNSGLLDRITGLKYFNIFGPNEQHKGEMRSLVDKAFHQIRDGGAVRLFKSHRPEFHDGEQRRDFLYVRDAVEMTLHVGDRPAFGLYNIGSGTASTWLDLVRPIFRAMAVAENIEFVDMPPTLRGKYQYHTVASMDRFRATNYHRATTPLADAVTDYVANYLITGKSLELRQAVKA